ncbi:hypothetical protein CRUP_000464 [Coryphaenoides rupestris]|nr:hypothetical protein CRUP_000464 [Coryphaenoides rupestris]
MEPTEQPDCGPQCGPLLQDLIEGEEWFHGRLGREQAETLLSCSGDFLVRESCSTLEPVLEKRTTLRSTTPADQALIYTLSHGGSDIRELQPNDPDIGSNSAPILHWRYCTCNHQAHIVPHLGLQVAQILRLEFEELMNFMFIPWLS